MNDVIEPGGPLDDPERRSEWRRPAVLLCFATWCLLTLHGVLHHEPWGDEADAWLYARDVPLSSFFDGAGYAGTPMLWYVLQAPFARLGLPYEAQAVIHWIIAASAMAVFYARAPFPLWARLAFSLSYYGVFEYAVVARSYSLTLLLLWCACASFTRRRDGIGHGVAIALLAQTNVPGMALAGSIGLVGLIDLVHTRTSSPPSLRGLVGIAVAGIGLVLAVLQVLPPDDGQKTGIVSNWTSTSFTTGLVDSFFPFGEATPRALAGGMAFACVLLSLSRSRLALGFFVSTWACLTFVFGFVYGGYLRHHGFMVIAFVGAAWLATERLRTTTTTTATTTPRLLVPAILLTVLMLPWVAEGLRMIDAERTGRFSNAPVMVDYLKRRGLIDREFAVSFAATVAVPWLDRDKVWDPALKRRRTYLPWNAEQRNARKLPPTALAHRVRLAFPEGQRPLLLIHRELPDHEKRGFRLIHVENDTVVSQHGENSWLYAPIDDPLRPEPGDRSIDLGKKKQKAAAADENDDAPTK